MNTLLTIFVCALVAVVVCSADETFYETKKICQEETGATQEMISDALRGKVADDPKLINYFVCSNKRGGVIDDEGHLHKDALKKKLMTWVKDESRIDAAIEKCLFERATIEETSVELPMCTYKELHK